MFEIISYIKLIWIIGVTFCIFFAVYISLMMMDQSNEAEIMTDKMIKDLDSYDKSDCNRLLFLEKVMSNNIYGKDYSQSAQEKIKELGCI